MTNHLENVRLALAECPDSRRYAARALMMYYPEDLGVVRFGIALCEAVQLHQWRLRENAKAHSYVDEDGTLVIQGAVTRLHWQNGEPVRWRWDEMIEFSGGHMDAVREHMDGGRQREGLFVHRDDARARLQQLTGMTARDANIALRRASLTPSVDPDQAERNRRNQRPKPFKPHRNRKRK